MITIISYCDKPEKKIQLKSLIDSIKQKRPDEQILLYSHYQDLEPEWYVGVNYYIYDWTNPKAEKTFCNWKYMASLNKRFYRCGDDWGFAVLQMIKRSCLYLSDIGISRTTIINYDIDPLCIEQIVFPELNDNEIGAFSNWGSDTEINLTYMHLDINRMGRDFFKSLTWDLYHSFDASVIPERAFYEILKNRFDTNWKWIERISTVFGVSRDLEENHPLRKYFTTILPTRNNYIANHHKCITLWNTNIKISKIEVEICDMKFTLFNELTGEESNISFFSHLPGGLDIQKITLYRINDQFISPYIMDELDTHYWNCNFHEPHF